MQQHRLLRRIDRGIDRDALAVVRKMSAAIALAGFYDNLLALEEVQYCQADAAVGDNIDLMFQRSLDSPEVRQIPSACHVECEAAVGEPSIPTIALGESRHIEGGYARAGGRQK
jgi:hypothetical protein